MKNAIREIYIVPIDMPEEDGVWVNADSSAGSMRAVIDYLSDWRIIESAGFGGIPEDYKIKDLSYISRLAKLIRQYGHAVIVLFRGIYNVQEEVVVDSSSLDHIEEIVEIHFKGEFTSPEEYIESVIEDTGVENFPNIMSYIDMDDVIQEMNNDGIFDDDEVDDHLWDYVTDDNFADYVNISRIAVSAIANNEIYAFNEFEYPDSWYIFDKI